MRLKAIITILTTALIISCELSITPEEWSSTNNRPCTTRSISDAKKIAIEALSTFTQESQTKTLVHKISNVYTIKSLSTKSMNSDTLMYVVNFENSNGFALVAAAPENPALLALSHNGNYNGVSTDCPAFDIYIDGLKEALINNSTKDGIIDNFKRLDFDTTLITRTLAPQITCDWHQNAPFNSYCIVNDSICPAGCGPVAVAHAISRFSTPSHIDLTFSNAITDSLFIDWDECKNHNYYHGSCDFCNANALLLREIGERCQTTYATSGSSTSLTKMKDCLTSFNLESQYHSQYDFDAILNSLNTNQTVILRGGRSSSLNSNEEIGHFWNTDGYIYREETIKCYEASDDSALRLFLGFQKTQTWYLHFEFGWQSSYYDGYYIGYARRSEDGWGFNEVVVDRPIITMFQCPEPINYTNNIYMLTNIHPID